MKALALNEFHSGLNARFTEVNGCEAVEHYGDPQREHDALLTSAGVMDLSFRGRLCVTGADRARFLNGQVTNNIKDLQPGHGCYAALVNARGRLESDLYVHCLRDELLLDFEPGLADAMTARLVKFIIADDAQIVDAAPHYGLLSVQGPASRAVVQSLGLQCELPPKPLTFTTTGDPATGEIYLMNLPRIGTTGFDLFVPVALQMAVAEKLLAAARLGGGGVCGWSAWEMARMEAAVPRFGVDMDESNLPQEAGLESRAISYSKGCYIGQEIIARIHTRGEVARNLRLLRLGDNLEQLPLKDDKLFHDGKEAGHITSAIHSTGLKADIAFAYVRKDASAPGTPLTVRTPAGERTARVERLPFGG